MESLSYLFLMDTTAKAMAACAEQVRQAIFAKLAELTSDPPGSHASPVQRLSTHVCLSDVFADHEKLSIAFAMVRDTFVVLDVAARHALSSEQLENDVDTLAHVDLRQFGLLVETVTQRRKMTLRLHRAVDLYCRRWEAPATCTAYPLSRYVQMDAAADLTYRILIAHERTWPSSEARQNFKDVLDGAAHRPQVIQRGDQRFLVVEESTLPAIIGRKSAAELYREFFEGELEPIEPFKRVPGTAPGRLLDMN